MNSMQKSCDPIGAPSTRSPLVSSCGVPLSVEYLFITSWSEVPSSLLALFDAVSNFFNDALA